MGHILHGSARTTPKIRRELQNSQKSVKELALEYNITQNTVRKWRSRESVTDMSHRPKKLRTVLSEQDEAIIITFRKATQLPLDDCLDALIDAIPQLTRSNLYRCLLRYGLSHLPKSEEYHKEKKAFKRYEIGYVHVDITEFTLQAKKYYIFVGICRISKFVFVRVYERQTAENAVAFLNGLVQAFPFKVHTILTDNGSQFTHTAHILRLKPSSRHKFDLLCSKLGIKHKTTAPYTPQTNGQVERFNRTLKEATIQKYHYDDISQAVTHLDDFIIAYNVGKKLSALKRKTPMQFILNTFKENPTLFNINPHHLLLGLNT
jgi:transposase InsO family protein